MRADWGLIEKGIAKISSQISNSEISKNLVLALIAAEDHRYKIHPGVDMFSMCRAIWRTYACGRREGGSTIAMQLVRVLTGKYERTVRRKALEMFYALLLTKRLGKIEIPRFYLFVAYYGAGMNGLLQATKELGLDYSDISIGDAVRVVARLKYPEPKSSGKIYSDKIKKREAYILSRLDEVF
ncbi:biosynthetic peptidoglycan transglycosylase [Pseudomonas sp. Gutcm_11s]|uniref:biosynthetic peptidoglycan transglycosylase n=1 Tax=Pseudomonas sp. Gutcm_11s TaxID=3026088 RepID=UPI0023625FDD|nr:biosynthetic peptidoglycan transglycosylase [Pseudomonas sp. Gutcm_11s]MDD0844812.1 transglycosylase domain-containing protein [Pseudomonas sp. Gutcm_11s]